MHLSCGIRKHWEWQHIGQGHGELLSWRPWVLWEKIKPSFNCRFWWVWLMKCLEIIPKRREKEHAVFLKKKIFIYLKVKTEREREKGREGERERDNRQTDKGMSSLVTSQILSMAWTAHSKTLLGFPCGCRGPSTCAIHTCFSRHISKELDQKWCSWARKGVPIRNTVFAGVSLTHLCHNTNPKNVKVKLG